ncbi:MAG TPA: thiamine pyrophosphate-dependent dehydrogenase E1 component subunit alpha [Anaerolineaceae bacterium]|nr:thiamine pyrophosphate-dependent dehydrogenase E1 component subunit alpha [Anaerolineaceae bacterium]HPN51036.1 thiamine pyrophosphate-dependent dehydrogenase E1 component subunit alpha [Anaerolineaceae bacterium]
MDFNLLVYRQMLLIRLFEEMVLEQFSRGVFSGTTHTSLGQEANAAGIISQLAEEDIVVSNHRCHGHFLAYGGDPAALFAEMMGKPSGVCGGVGGSQHLHWKNFYSNGILGGMMPVAVGMALAEKRLGSQAVVTAFLGDGAVSEGAVYEAINMASLWGAPVLFVVENNHIAQTTPTELALAGDLAARFAAFGLPVRRMDSSDVVEIAAAARSLLDEVRGRQKPAALIIDTVRFGPHSKGDDTRPVEEMARLMRERDPLTLHGARLTQDEQNRCWQEMTGLVAEAFEKALQAPGQPA